MLVVPNFGANFGAQNAEELFPPRCWRNAFALEGGRFLHRFPPQVGSMSLRPSERTWLVVFWRVTFSGTCNTPASKMTKPACVMMVVSHFF